MASPSPSFREAVAVQTEWGHFSQRRRVFFCTMQQKTPSASVS